MYVRHMMSHCLIGVFAVAIPLSPRLSRLQKMENMGVWMTDTHNNRVHQVELSRESQGWRNPNFPKAIRTHCRYCTCAKGNPLSPKFDCHSKLSDTRIPLPPEIGCRLISSVARHAMTLNFG